MADEYNELESSIASALQMDEWLGNKTNVAVIEEKFTREIESAYEHQLPRIGVLVIGEESESDIGQAYYRRTFNILIEVICAGGYSPQVDTDLKHILAEIRRFFREENRKDIRLNIPGIIEISNGDMHINYNFESEHVHVGYTNVKVTINQQ